MNQNRYDRQQLIENWDQTKLDNAKVVIVGDGLLGNFTLMATSAMGFGDIEYYNPVGNVSIGRNIAANSMVDMSKKINPDVDILGIKLDVARNLDILGQCDVIIDATNDPNSKVSLVEHCIANEIPLISASSTSSIGQVGVFDPRKVYADKDKLIENLFFLDCAHDEQGIETSGVIAGMVVEEARKIVAPIGPEKTIEDIVLYYPWEKPHFIRHELRMVEPGDISDLAVAMVGAGALGNPCGLSLTLNNVGQLDIFDFDDIEDTNLNRQFLFYGAVGRQKSDVLKERLQRINKRPTINAYNKRISLDDVGLFKDYDVIIDCVDNFKTRALLNYISRKHKIPLISGGSSYQAGQVITCKDACLDCQFDINAKAEANYRQTQGQSCIYAPTPSVITSNMIIGFMQAAQVRNLEQKENTILKYISGEEFRVGELQAVQKCGCKAQDLLKTIKGFYND